MRDVLGPAPSADGRRRPRARPHHLPGLPGRGGATRRRRPGPRAHALAQPRFRSVRFSGRRGHPAHGFFESQQRFFILTRLRFAFATTPRLYAPPWASEAGRTSRQPARPSSQPIVRSATPRAAMASGARRGETRGTWASGVAATGAFPFDAGPRLPCPGVRPRPARRARRGPAAARPRPPLGPAHHAHGAALGLVGQGRGHRGVVAKAKRKRVKVKKRCCDSKKPCAGCPRRPENRKLRKRG